MSLCSLVCLSGAATTGFPIQTAGAMDPCFPFSDCPRVAAHSRGNMAFGIFAPKSVVQRNILSFAQFPPLLGVRLRIWMPFITGIILSLRRRPFGGRPAGYSFISPSCLNLALRRLIVSILHPTALAIASTVSPALRRTSISWDWASLSLW